MANKRVPGYVAKSQNHTFQFKYINTVLSASVHEGELGPNEVSSFEVTVVQGADTLVVTPYQLADLADNDNNIDLCLKEAGTPVLLKVREKVAIDPNGDQNPVTKVEVVSRW